MSLSVWKLQIPHNYKRLLIIL